MIQSFLSFILFIFRVNVNNDCNETQEKDPLIYDFNNGRVIFNPLVNINQTDNLNI